MLTVHLLGPHPSRPGGVSSHLAALAPELAQRVQLARSATGRVSPFDLLGPLRRPDLAGADVVHLNPSLRIPALLRDAWVSAGAPRRVIHLHGWDPAMDRGLRRARVSLAPTTCLVTLSEGFRQRALAWGLSPEQVEVIGPCARAFDLPPLDPDGPRLFVGRLDRNKQVDRLIRLCDRELWVVGDGPDRSRLEALARGRPVRFVGAVADVSPYLAAGSALLLSSGQEGLPVVILEALAAGRPVVSTAVGAVAEVLPEAVPPGDDEAFRRALAEVRPPDAGRVAAIRARCAPAAVAAAFVAVYERVMERA